MRFTVKDKRDPAWHEVCYSAAEAVAEAKVLNAAVGFSSPYYAKIG